jgi:hypothetical protein
VEEAEEVAEVEVLEEMTGVEEDSTGIEIKEETTMKDQTLRDMMTDLTTREVDTVLTKIMVKITGVDIKTKIIDECLRMTIETITKGLTTERGDKDLVVEIRMRMDPDLITIGIPIKDLIIEMSNIIFIKLK